MKIIFLQTDVLFFSFLGIVVGYFCLIFKRKQTFDRWKSIFEKPLASSASVILMFYLIVAVFDSIHFEVVEKSPNFRVGQVVSVLDRHLISLSKKVERTYSAPLAYRSYAKETVLSDNGKIERVYPRLTHAGSHLDNPESEHTKDLLCISLDGFVRGILIWTFWIACFFIIRIVIFQINFSEEFHQFFRKKSIAYPILTVGIISIIVGICIELSAYYHVLGTDKVGQDILYQSLKSIRTGVIIGTLTTLVIIPFALIFGVAAGYFGGWVDDIIQFLYTTLSSIPGVLLIAASALMLEVYMAKQGDFFENLTVRADLRLLALCVILGITAWTGLCRYIRAETLKLKESDFVAASIAFGGSSYRTILRHIIPNLMHIVMIAVVLDFSGLVLAEAALSYIDIGVDPSMESWGNMINGARLELARDPVVWWALVSAFLFMFFLVLAANIFADAVRDSFDPKLKETL